MKPIHKKIVTGALAAGLLIGGGLTVHNQAFADETGSSVSVTDVHKETAHKGVIRKGGFQGSPEFKMGGLDFATILGVDSAVLKEEMKQGKTLAEIAQDKAGLSEDELLAKLTEAETKKIDNALSAGEIQQEQADKLKANLVDRLKKIVEGKGPAGQLPGKGHPKPHGGVAANWGSGKLADMLGITKEDLAAQLKAGNSLADIAQNQGLSEDELIAKLKDNMTDSLKKFVEHKGNGHNFEVKPIKKSDAATATEETAD